MGFTSSVTIPVLVLGHRDINIFRDVDVANLSLVFPLVSPKGNPERKRKKEGEVLRDYDGRGR